MQRGYIKLWRKSLDSEWLSNHVLWCFWCWCLLKATHKPIEQLVGYQKVQLEPGQFVFGIHKASRAINASPQQIRTCLRSLEILGNLTKKSTNKYSIISIVNWDSYQQTEIINNNQLNNQLTNEQQATNYKQEHKEHKEQKNKKREGSNGIPEWIPKDLWADFKEYRIRIKAPLTDRATKNLISKLESLKKEGQDPVACINEAITRGWRGIFALDKAPKIKAVSYNSPEKDREKWGMN
jgi:hypothetical protein